MHVFPYSPRPGTDDGGSTTRPAAGRRRSAAPGCASSRASSSGGAGTASSAADDVVLVDRPGRGYGDDYSPFLVDAPVGELVRVRAEAVTRGGDPCRRSVTTACSAGSSATATYVAQTKGFVAIKDINPQAPVHLLIIPEHHVDSFREIGEFSAARDEADARVRRPRRRATVGLVDYRVLVNVGPSAGQTVFHLHWHVLGASPATRAASRQP